MPPKKIAYILPEYDDKTDTHLSYNYELIRGLYGKMNLFVVIEKAAFGENINLGQQFVIQKQKIGILRFLELVKILKRLKAEGYDDFYVHYSYYGALAAWYVGGRIFYWNRGMPWLFKRGFIEEQLFRFVLKHSILVTSPESLAKEYVARYKVPEYRILSNWIDVDRYYPREDKAATKSWLGLSNETKVVLFVHHLSERKGADLITPIAANFAKENILFLVAGDGPLKARLEFEAQNSLTAMKILGPVPNRDIALYLQAADVFIMPSREEGSPHVLLETMAAGTPFVASEVGGVREIIPPGFEELLVKPDDVAGFVSKIKMLFSDQAKYDQFRAEGVKFSYQFDKDRGVKEFIGLFT